MATVGPTICGTGASVAGIGTIAWNNPGNITADDSSYAVVGVDSTHKSNWLEGTNFGFNVPGGATINGIQVEWKRKSGGTGGAQVSDWSLLIVKGGVTGGNDHSAGAAWNTTEQWDSFGNSSDLWGLAWTPSDINASNFGAALSCLGALSGTASVNACRITVTYTAAAGGVFVAKRELTGMGAGGPFFGNPLT